MAELSSWVEIWWLALCMLSVVNLVIWAHSARRFLRLRETPNWHVYGRRWPHLVLSAVYVVGCGFRSVLPRADVQRIVLYDSWLSSVMVGRSVATIAELCFAAQWALLLRELASAERQTYGMVLSRLIVPFIAIAEVCSWYAVLTTSYLGNTLEQSIWTGTVALMAVSLGMIAWRAQGQLRAFLSGAVVACAGFVAFMCSVDVKMYLTRFLADEARGRAYLDVTQGLVDVSTRWVVTHAWTDWQQEIAWMSLYFSVAVWISIALVHAPRALGRSEPARVLTQDSAHARGAVVQGALSRR